MNARFYKKVALTLFALAVVTLTSTRCGSDETEQPLETASTAPEEEITVDDDGVDAEAEQPIDDDGIDESAGFAGTVWQLQVIRDFDALMAAAQDSPAIIEFREDGTFQMSTGCGEVGGTYTLDGANVTFAVMMSSGATACTDDGVAQALAVEDFLPKVTSHQVQGTKLTLSIDANNDAVFEQRIKIDDDGIDE